MQNLKTQYIWLCAPHSPICTGYPKQNAQEILLEMIGTRNEVIAYKKGYWKWYENNTTDNCDILIAKR